MGNLTCRAHGKEERLFFEEKPMCIVAVFSVQGGRVHVGGD